MRIELRSSLWKIVFALACCVFVTLYVALSLRTYVASRLAAVPNVANLQRAIRLEPSNAEYRELLGRNLALSVANVDEAIAHYRTAVDLNPYDARSWLDLAGAYQIAGRTSEQEQSVEHAVEADPNTPHVAWEAANFFLLQGEQGKALPYFKVVLANDPEVVDATLQMCWRVTGDANQMVSDVLPRRPDVYFSFLHLLIAKQQIDAAKSVWSSLIALHQEFPAKLAFPYFQFLIAKQEVAAAQTAWAQAATLDRSLQPYLPSRENLVVNGGFEENVLNGGFDWWYHLNPHAALAIDTTEFAAGTRSLSITFDGQNPEEAGIFQFIPVKPNTDYEFAAAYRAAELDTASGPRFSITDPYTNLSYVLSDDILGSNPWRPERAQFHTMPNTNLVLLKIVRQPAQPLIRGKLWIDDVKLIEK
jgi:tetratricopeptide (TPR) repeat protein